MLCVWIFYSSYIFIQSVHFAVGDKYFPIVLQLLVSFISRLSTDLIDSLIAEGFSTLNSFNELLQMCIELCIHLC